MEFAGVLGFDGLMGGSSEGGSGGGGLFSSTPPSSELEHCRQRGLFGSGNLKHGRSGCVGGGQEEHGDWRSLKMARVDQPMLTAQPKASSSSFLRSNPHSLFSDGEQMLSFSTSRPADTMLLSTEGSLPYYRYPSPYSPAAASYARTSGMGSGSSSASMHGVLAGVKGPFTPSQWMELEHQALIYKYIDANMPIPSSLLLSIRRGLNPSGYSVYSAGSFRHNPLSWGTFSLGFSGNVDPEPGRCRRTDGKKWRCSRDAVSDQKYCERHMNRGRHRSRKHVEGQNGHAAKAMPIIAPSQAASAVSGGRSTNSLSITQHQMKSLQNDTDRTSAQHSRMLLTKANTDDRGLSMLTTVNSKATNTLFPISKQHNTFEGTSSGADFGLFSSDSLLNHHSENISFDRQPQSHSLRHFINDLPKDQSDHSTITWPEVEDMQSERTQLSISIPMASSDFSSSSSSPNHEKPTLSPLRLSRELDPIHMGLGVGVMNEVNQRQVNWIPISWEASLGGPLGEVLVSTNNTPRDHSKNCSSSSLNLLTDGWDSSPRIRSSPTDVLHKTTFCSVSGSTGSSPRAENHKAHDSTSSLCEDLLGSTLVHPSTIPSL